MRKPAAALLLLVIVTTLVWCKSAVADQRPAVTIFVSTVGDDAWSGSLAEPNAAKTDGPLATLEAARDKIRTLKKNGPLSAGGVTVVLRGGIYCLAKTFQLTQADSGTADAPVVYRAAEGEKVQVLGGRPITGFVSYKGSILKADVAAQGFKGVYFRQLFFDAKRQHLARYPNYDPQNPYGGGWAYADGPPLLMYQDVPNESRRTLQYRAKDARHWSRPEEGEVFVFARFNWWNDIVPIKSVDRKSRTITLTNDASYAVRATDRYYMQGLFEELDAPGEWYLDRRTETLYFWPPAPLEGKMVYAPTVDTLVAMGPGTAYVTLRGLTLECCYAAAVVLSHTHDCLVAGNTVRNAGDYNGSGIALDGGRNNGAVGNDVYEIGRIGIAISGGDRATLTPAGNYADNNYIHHTGVFYKQGTGINMEGVGNRATHNLIHDCPRFGIGFGGNNLLIEYNHIRHVNLETEDTGAVYTGGRDWISSRGTVIRYNFFHDMLGYGRKDGKWESPHFAWGVYLDDNAGGIDVIGNIVARAMLGPIHLHNGRDNHIENNVFVDGTQQQIQYSGWTTAHPFWKEHLKTMIPGYDLVAGQPAWRGMRHMELRPEKAPLPDGTIMAGNVLRRNILYYRTPSAALYCLRDVSLHDNRFDENLAYHFGLPLKIDFSMSVKSDVKADPKDMPTDRWPAWWQAQGQDQHSIVADPLFVDPEHDDYRLKPDSPALKLGFQPIPIEKIGPYADPLRASWPIVEAEGAREKPLHP
jgi:hypothetical protein